MARQTGPLKYTGTIGDIRHFKIKGLKGACAGMIGGPSAEQIATAPEFARTRENMNEFGACALVGKALRVGLASGINVFTISIEFYQEVNGIQYSLKNGGYNSLAVIDVV